LVRESKTGKTVAAGTRIHIRTAYEAGIPSSVIRLRMLHASRASTDCPSADVANNPVSVHDLHATMLQLCGVDHRRMTFPSQGLDERLTGVEQA
jgi:hypothetical protein